MKPSIVIAGLGNPGASYARTRHNVGWQAIDALADVWKATTEQQSGRFDARTREASHGGESVLFLKPMLFMNRSGESIRRCVDFYKLNPAASLIICCDDIDLPLGTLRWRMNGGPGTHNGLRSIVTEIGEEFVRLRIGLGQPKSSDIDLATWVLSVPPPDEQTLLAQSLEEIPTLMDQMIEEMKRKKG